MNENAIVNVKLNKNSLAKLLIPHIIEKRENLISFWKFQWNAECFVRNFRLNWTDFIIIQFISIKPIYKWTAQIRKRTRTDSAATREKLLNTEL